MARKKNNSSSDNLFLEEDGALFNTSGLEGGSYGLEVCYSKFLKQDRLEDWRELFLGFDNIRIITFSSSASMITRLLKTFNFKSFQVIFGNQEVFKGFDYLKELIMEANGLIGALTGNDAAKVEFLKNKLLDGSLEINIAKPNVLSHEKIYVLWSDNPDGTKKVRVITGSANMSLLALSGKQKENISIYDDDLAAFEYYDARFESFLEDTLQKIEPQHLKPITQVEDLLKDNAVIKNIIECNNTVYIEEVHDDAETEETAIYVENTEKVKEMLEKLNLNSVLDGAVKKQKDLLVIDPANIKKVQKQYSVNVKKYKEKQEFYPEMYVDSAMDVYVNDSPVDLDDISKEDISNDIRLFKNFFEGYYNGCFEGAIDRAVEKYYASVVYAFVSPFMHYCVKKAKFGINSYDFPCYLILRGPKSAGKTPFFSFLLKLMFNEYHFNCEETGSLIRKSSDLSAKQGLVPAMLSGKGFPIIVDELIRDRAKEYEEIFKNPRLFLEEYCSCVLFTCNDDFEISDYSLKRSVLFNINMANNHNQSGILNTVVANTNGLTGALYKEFLARFTDRFVDLINEFDDIKNISENTTENLYVPDILKLGSQVLLEIFQDFDDGRDCPYIRIYDRNFYRDGLSNLDERKSEFIEDYKFGVWQVDEKHNALIRKFEGFTAQRKAKEFADGMNQPYKIRVAGDTVRIDLKWARQFFGYDFRDESEDAKEERVIIQERIIEKPVEVIQEKIVEVEKPVEVIKEKIVEVEKTVEVVKEVPQEKPKGLVDKIKFLFS